MKLANFLNKIFKKGGFILIDANKKNYNVQMHRSLLRRRPMPLLWGDVVLILLLFPCAPALPVVEDVEFIDFKHERSLPGTTAKEEIRVVWSESQNTEGSYFKRLSQLISWESELLVSPSPWPHPEDDDEQVEEEE